MIAYLRVTPIGRYPHGAVTALSELPWKNRMGYSQFTVSLFWTNPRVGIPYAQSKPVVIVGGADKQMSDPISASPGTSVG